MNKAVPAGRLERLSGLRPRYDGLLCDAWGVVHNGVRPYPSAVAALAAWRASGGQVILITNAARTAPLIGRMFEGMGIAREAYDAIVTSGDVTRALIGRHRGQTVHHVGVDTNLPLLEGLGVTLGSAEEASAVVVTALEDPDETPADYEDRLNDWRARNLPLICANPDKIVEVGDKMVYCPGALADIYAEKGGEVVQAGKPYPAIYDASLAALDKAAGHKVPRDRVLAIGDSVRTDAAGAAATGADFLFITGSIHAEELNALGEPDAKAIEQLVAPSGANLIGFQTRLA